MYFAEEDLMSHRPPNQCRCDVVEKTGKQPRYRQQHEAALPIVRKKFWEHNRHVTLFKMTRQQRKTHQQAKQIDQDHPFVLDVSDETHNAIASLKTGERDFIDRDRHQATESNAQGITVEHRYTEQRQTE